MHWPYTIRGRNLTHNCSRLIHRSSVLQALSDSNRDVCQWKVNITSSLIWIKEPLSEWHQICWWMGWWIEGNYINLKSSERRWDGERQTDKRNADWQINRTKQENKSNQVFSTKKAKKSSLTTFIFVCFVRSRLLWQRSERHHSVCCLFPARQWPRGLPWNNGEPLPVSITPPWIKHLRLFWSSKVYIRFTGGLFRDENYTSMSQTLQSLSDSFIFGYKHPQTRWKLHLSSLQLKWQSDGEACFLRPPVLISSLLCFMPGQSGWDPTGCSVKDME